MNSKQAAILRRLKAIENKAYAAMGCLEADVDMSKPACIAWKKASDAIKDFAASLPFGGAR